ncbi:MAG: P-II family nitrogen regulator [Lachnospiraceae bacterium]|nr:P-II family nitrogen regulator [Lachnospiraceae bacterium]
MNNLYMMVTITNRNLTRKFTNFYEENGVDISIATGGRGTAASEILDYFGLDGAEKSVLFHVVTGATWKNLKAGLRRKMQIDIPGIGIAFLIPISSIGGKKALSYLTDGQNFAKGEESTLKDTKYELLVVIANHGYTELIMDAARSVHAAGGTVIHAKGTGIQKAEKFLGVTLVPEKEMVFIVVRKNQKNDIMRAIMDQAGLESKARSIVFSLPVTDTAGMRLIEEMEAEEEVK